jgi:hypothetical protein
MVWGHRLKRLTKRERELCQWGCGVCDEPVEYLSDYDFDSRRGHAAQAHRPLCAEHARQFAVRFRVWRRDSAS